MARRMPSNMAHAFSQVPRATVPRSTFKRNHGYKTTFDAGYLVPVYVDEALPGDTININMTAFARLATPIKPIMDNIFLDTFFFAVPIRLIWDNWQRMNGEQDNPGDTTDYTVPQMVSPAGGYDPDNAAEQTRLSGQLSDYFGIPTKVANLSHSALWHRAYNLIYNEWFRDQNLQSSVPVDKGDANSDPADYVLLRRGKRHDYFTSALPFPQKGPAVELPLGSEAPVLGIGKTNTTWPSSNAQVLETGGSALTTYASASTITGANADETWVGEEDPNNPTFPYIRADLSEATAATINQLREAFQIQKLYERDARGGTRYIEIIKSHFGVISPDARLQRPEYLGGGSTAINVSAIAQTTPSDVVPDATPQGNLAAIGTASLNRNGFTKSFTEHCVIIGMVNARADLSYQEGLDRMFSRRTRFDFFWPAFAHLGEQEIRNKEIYAQGTADDDLVFGYQERYAEYRYKKSNITGKFRSNATAPLDVWHLAQTFPSLPALNETFIQDDPPIDRVIAVNTEPHFIFDSYFQLRHTRPMPTYSVPGWIDHF